MTTHDRFTACLAVSFAVHFLATGWGGQNEITAGTPETMTLDISPSGGDFADGEASVVDAAESGNAEDRASQREQARKSYMNEVSEAIHARRFADSAARAQIGTAWYRFTIRADGSFSTPRMIRSSGHPLLDHCAEHAIREASGVVRRPVALGAEAIDITLPIKYQYSL